MEVEVQIEGSKKNYSKAQLWLVVCGAQRWLEALAEFSEPVFERLNRIRLCHRAPGPAQSMASTTALKPPGSAMAISARTLRSSAMFDRLRPAMNWL